MRTLLLFALFILNFNSFAKSRAPVKDGMLKAFQKYGCSGINYRKRIIKKTCPSGERVETELHCQEFKSGRWPQCEIFEECEVIKEETCPIITETPDGDRF